MSSTESGVVWNARRAPSRSAHAAPAPVERSRASRSIARQRRSPLAPVPRWSNPITLKRSSSDGTREQDVDHLDDPRAARAAREVHEVLGARAGELPAGDAQRHRARHGARAVERHPQAPALEVARSSRAS